MGRRWANRLQLALLSLLAGIAGLSAWVAAVCPPATVCLTPPPGCVSSVIWSGPACSTDSPYCCQYYVRSMPTSVPPAVVAAPAYQNRSLVASQVTPVYQELASRVAVLAVLGLGAVEHKLAGVATLSRPCRHLLKREW